MRISDWSSDVCSSDLLGFRGLRLLFVCLFLGVATLAAIGSLTSAITDELAARGQTLLGGDIEIAMTQREASASEKAALGGLGALSETIRMRAMAQRPGAAGGDEPLAVLTALKGRSEEHTSELQSLMRHSYAVFCLKKNTNKTD